MSVNVLLESLPMETRKKMSKELEFKSKQSFFAQKYGNDNSIIISASIIKSLLSLKL